MQLNSWSWQFCCMDTSLLLSVLRATEIVQYIRWLPWMQPSQVWSSALHVVPEPHHEWGEPGVNTEQHWMCPLPSPTKVITIKFTMRMRSVFQIVLSLKQTHNFKEFYCLRFFSTYLLRDKKKKAHVSNKNQLLEVYKKWKISLDFLEKLSLGYLDIITKDSRGKRRIWEGRLEDENCRFYV